MKIERILLPTDLSPSADRAMEQAVEIAVQQRSKLDVFHVVTLDNEDPTRLEEAIEEYMDRVEKEVFEELSERSETIRTRGVTVAVSTARSFSAYEAIADKVTELGSDLIVMGTHGRSGVGKLLMGSVAEKVVRHAPVNVMTVGEHATVAEGERGFDRILVPVDFTDYSVKALDVAKGFLAPGGELDLLHVVSSPIHPSFYAGGLTRWFQIDPELPARIRQKLSELYSGPGELIVEEGGVTENILRSAESQKARLIVMGTRGLTGLDHVLVGSATERVIRKAAVPVLAVK